METKGPVGKCAGALGGLPARPCHVAQLRFLGHSRLSLVATKRSPPPQETGWVVAIPVVRQSPCCVRRATQWNISLPICAPP